MCVCLARFVVERSPLWPIVIRERCEKLSLNPYSIHGGSESKEERGWVGNGQQNEKNMAPPHRPQLNE